MRSTLLSSILVVGLSTAAAAQGKQQPKQAGTSKAAAIAWSDLVGDWEGKSMRGTSDSVITAVTYTFTPDNRVIVHLPNRPPIPTKLITMGGDSVVFETAQYNSVTRPGHKVMTRQILHIANHKGHGTTHAVFDDKQVTDNRTTVAHKLH